MNSLTVCLFLACVATGVVRSQSPCDSISCINGYCTTNALNLAVCQCEPGYKPSGVPRICIDIDECVEYDFLCNNQPGCCNTLGSFYCYPCVNRQK